MNTRHQRKPSIEEWLHCAEIAIDRLTDCVHIYKKPPHEDVFIPDAERQQKTDLTIKLLHRGHALADRSDTPTDSVHDAHGHDEQIVDGLGVFFEEVLRNLPWLSADMQKLLKSPWLSKFPSKTAQILFGGDGNEEQGIGSGHPEHGRLPALIARLLEREQEGDNRHPREDLLQHGEPRRHDVEARTRWKEQNSRFLRSAGRVE